MREIAGGVWHWEARHPEWVEGEDWGPDVSCYAFDDGTRLLLFDPLELPERLVELAGERETAIVLTCPWHRRDAALLAPRIGAAIYVPPADPRDPEPVAGIVYEAGERLPIGVVAHPGMERNDLVLWVEDRAALVAGDTLIDAGEGLELPLAWVDKDVPPAQLLAALQPLLELPVELVLPTHGRPADRAALELALA